MERIYQAQIMVCALLSPSAIHACMANGNNGREWNGSQFQFAAPQSLFRRGGHTWTESGEPAEVGSNCAR